MWFIHFQGTQASECLNMMFDLTILQIWSIHLPLFSDEGIDMRTLKSQTVGIRSTGEFLHPAQYPFTYFTSSSSGSYLHLVSSSYLWLKSIPPSEISILQYTLLTWNCRCRYNGIWRRAARRILFRLWSIDYGKSRFVPLRKVHASYLRSVFHDDVKIELIRRRPVVSGCPQIWQSRSHFVQTSIVETLMARRPERESVI